MRRTFAIATLLALPFATLAACGGDDDDASGTPGDNSDSTETTASGETEDTEPTDDTDAPAGGDAVTVVAEDIEWTEDSYTATAGEVAFVLENQDSIRHTLVIDGVDEDTFKLESGGSDESDEGSVELEAGEYEIFCDVPGHTAMRSTLTVE
jgi:plastocyanin